MFILMIQETWKVYLEISGRIKQEILLVMIEMGEGTEIGVGLYKGRRGRLLCLHRGACSRTCCNEKLSAHDLCLCLIINPLLSEREVGSESRLVVRYYGGIQEEFDKKSKKLIENL